MGTTACYYRVLLSYDAILPSGVTGRSYVLSGGRAFSSSRESTRWNSSGRDAPKAAQRTVLEFKAKSAMMSYHSPVPYDYLGTYLGPPSLINSESRLLVVDMITILLQCNCRLSIASNKLTFNFKDATDSAESRLPHQPLLLSTKTSNGLHDKASIGPLENHCSRDRKARGVLPNATVRDWPLLSETPEYDTVMVSVLMDTHISRDETGLFTDSPGEALLCSGRRLRECGTAFLNGEKGRDWDASFVLGDFTTRLGKTTASKHSLID
ncbi:hypothetical protein ACRALDRAFT_209646 [Sodiomyces alcalophilus JCM 7366]|uniref:uncharacterized protein n=1 Tax=Sodiomyces alcalophilus JCM 7366 TaxID=591952 RepID=UPI0039B582E5